MTQTTLTPEVSEVCICFGIRKAARLVTKQYDDAFRPLNITSGQFSILTSMMRDVPSPLGSLANGLGMDRTTLTRNLKPMIAAGWVTEDADTEDRRIRGLSLTAEGRDLVMRAIEVWREVQASSLARLDGGWPALQSQLTSLY